MFAEREELAILRAQGRGVREIARHLGRAASTISRELRRNAATRSRGLEYRATTAQWHAERAACRPKVAKLATNAVLRSYVEERLAGVVVAGDSGKPGAVQRSTTQYPQRWMPARFLPRATRSYNAQLLLIQMPVARLIAAELSPLSER